MGYKYKFTTPVDSILKQQIISSGGDNKSRWNVEACLRQFAEVGTFSACEHQIAASKMGYWQYQRRRMVIRGSSGH